MACDDHPTGGYSPANQEPCLGPPGRVQRPGTQRPLGPRLRPGWSRPSPPRERAVPLGLSPHWKVKGRGHQGAVDARLPAVSPDSGASRVAHTPRSAASWRRCLAGRHLRASPGRCDDTGRRRLLSAGAHVLATARALRPDRSVAPVPLRPARQNRAPARSGWSSARRPSAAADLDREPIPAAFTHSPPRRLEMTRSGVWILLVPQAAPAAAQDTGPFSELARLVKIGVNDVRVTLNGGRSLEAQIAGVTSGTLSVVDRGIGRDLARRTRGCSRGHLRGRGVPCCDTRSGQGRSRHVRVERICRRARDSWPRVPRLCGYVRNPGDLERRIRPKLNTESGDVEHLIR